MRDRANPFRPGFGQHPHVIVGRDDLIAEFADLFTSGQGRAWATHLEAQRGTGKTVMLDAIQDTAAEAGWHVIQDDAGSTSSNLITRLTDRILATRDQLNPAPKRRIRKIDASVLGTGGGLELAHHDPAPPTTLRGAAESLLERSGTGLLITVDEIHAASDNVLSELGNAAQHLKRDGRKFAIVVAGLPQRTSAGPTFLSRCYKPAIVAVDDAEIARGLTETAAAGGAVFADRALLRAVEACAGSPYMLQLVGHHAYAHARANTIELDDVTAAIGPAEHELAAAVTLRIIDTLAPVETAFLRAMVAAGTPARIADIRAALDKPSGYVNVYRRRLIDTGLIRAVGYGKVDFAVPGLARLLADH